MAFIQLGTLDQLRISIPTKLTTNWADQLKDDFFQKVVEHDHSANGKGAQLGSSAFLDDSINQVKVRLDNDQFLRSRDAAGTGDIDVLKVDTEDEIVLGARVKQVDTDSVLADSATISTGDVDSLTVRKITGSGSISITSPGTSTLIPIDGNKHQILEYRIEYSGSVQSGSFRSSSLGSIFTEDFIGSDLGFVLDSSSGTSITIDTSSEPTISGANSVTINYILKEI